MDVLSRGIHTLGFVADYRSAARRDLQGNRGSNGVGNVNLIAGTCVETSHRQLVRVLIAIHFLIMLDRELLCVMKCGAGDLVFGGLGHRNNSIWCGRIAKPGAGEWRLLLPQLLLFFLRRSRDGK